MRIRIFIKRVIIYFILLLAAFIVQTCLFPLLGFLYAMPNLLIIVTFSYGFFYGSMTGMICGVFAGLIMDTFYQAPFGLFLLIYCIMGYFSGSFKNDLKNDSLVFPLVLCFVNEVFYNTVLFLYRFLVTGIMDIRYTITDIALPEIFFSMIVTLLIYRILLNTNRKLDMKDELRGRNVA